MDCIRHYKSFRPEGLVPNRPSSWNDIVVVLPEGSSPHVGASERSQSAAEPAHGPQRHRVSSTRGTYEPCQDTTNRRPMKDDSLNTNGCPETGAGALHFTSRWTLGASCDRYSPTQVGMLLGHPIVR
jgi:hypothetical protein